MGYEQAVNLRRAKGMDDIGGIPLPGPGPQSA